VLGLDATGHQRRVAGIVDQVRARPPDQNLTIRKSTPAHGVRDSRYKLGRHPVDVSGLDRILAVDPAALTAIVEGQVLIGQLCATTLAQRLLPRVVPEYRDFTVAGLIGGDGIQSSSHRHGTFTAGLVDAELVLGDGSVVRAMRALQRFVDSPSCWGVSYLTREELRATGGLDYDRYEAARGRYQAEAALLHVDDKVVWVGPDDPGSGKIPLWRLYLSFGPRWHLRPRALGTLLLALALNLIWPLWRRLLRGWRRVVRGP
jgi:hypothetical protein